MKKLFLLSLAILASFSLWAESLNFKTTSQVTSSIGTVTYVGTAYKASNASEASGYKLSSDNDGISWVLTSSTFTAASFNGYVNSGKTELTWTYSYSTDGGQTWGTAYTTNSQGKTYADYPLANVPSGANGIKILRSSGTSSYLAAITLTLAVTSYTVTYNANGGTGEMENSTNTISTCTFTAPDGYEFKEWNTAADGKGTSYAAGATATSDLDLYAIWQVHATSSDATLSALSVAGCTLSPAFASGTTAYTVALPFYASMPAVSDVTATKNDSYAKDPEVTIADNVISIACEAEDGTKKTYTITVNIADVPAASTSINIEQLVLDNGKSYDIAKALTDANITTDGRNGLDSINESKDYRNYAFFGLKLKKNNADVIKVVLPASTALNVKFGSIGGATKVIINNVETQTIAADKNKPNHFFHLDATAAAREVIFRSTANETLTLQQIKIGEECDDFTLPALFTVTYNAGAGECATTSDFVEFANDKITLPSVTPATGYAFNGWFNAAINGDKFGDAAEEKTLSKDTTLYAQFSRIDYIITYTVPTNGSYTIKVGDADAVSANTTAHYNDLVTLTITPSTGYELSTLSVKDAMDADVTVTDGKFTMPASNVTITATFKQEGGGTSIDNTSAATKAQKRIENGQLVIEKNGQVFNAMGQTIR